MDQKMIALTLDAWADAEAESAAKAMADGDERMRSIYLMKESMYRTMLKTLAVKAPGKLGKTAREMEERAAKFSAAGDLDSADRCIIQKACIENAMQLVGSAEVKA